MRNSRFTKSLALTGALMLSLIAMIFVFSEPAMAQATTGTLKGTVVDPNGGIITGATVTTKNDTTGVEKQFTTGGDGLFVITDLLPGKYTICRRTQQAAVLTPWRYSRRALCLVSATSIRTVCSFQSTATVRDRTTLHSMALTITT